VPFSNHFPQKFHLRRRLTFIFALMLVQGAPKSKLPGAREDLNPAQAKVKAGRAVRENRNGTGIILAYFWKYFLYILDKKHYSKVETALV
jgi:hypothetical protein